MASVVLAQRVPISRREQAEFLSGEKQKEREKN